jgi:hypothetical protein
MAKCIKNVKTDKIIRVDNEKARKMVDSKDYEYCSKFEYKRQKIGQD